VMNAANESAVDLFLKNQIRFADIPSVIESALEANEADFTAEPNLDQIVAADSWAREFVTERTMGTVMAKRTIDLKTKQLK
jgi:1-deoxy-D-xylulose-5-phosphate reductoisomerase